MITIIMNMITFVFILLSVLHISAALLRTEKMNYTDQPQTYEERRDTNILFFAVEPLVVNLTLNAEPYALCRTNLSSEVVLQKLSGGECAQGITPYEFHEIRVTLHSSNRLKIEGPSVGEDDPVFPVPLVLQVTISPGDNQTVSNNPNPSWVLYMTRMSRDPPAPKSTVMPIMIGVSVVLALLLVLSIIISCIFYLLIPGGTIRRIVFKSGSYNPGSTDLSTPIGQKEVQDTPPAPPRPTNIQNPCQTRAQLAKVPSSPLAPPIAEVNPLKHDTRPVDDEYDALHDPNYDYVQANVVRPVERAILERETAAANPRRKPPFRKISDSQSAKPPAAAVPPRYQTTNEDDYLDFGPGIPPSQQGQEYQQQQAYQPHQAYQQHQGYHQPQAYQQQQYDREYKGYPAQY